MLNILISVYLVGSLVFLTQATFTPEVFSAWNKGYYLWSFLTTVLFGLCILYPARNKRIFIPVFIVIVAKFISQCIFVFTETQLNDAKIVGTLFILAIFVCLYLFIKETITDGWRPLK